MNEIPKRPVPPEVVSPPIQILYSDEPITFDSWTSGFYWGAFVGIFLGIVITKILLKVIL